LHRDHFVNRWVRIAVLAAASMYLSFCSPPIRPSVPADQARLQMPELWEPADATSRDMTYGPWGREHQPRPSDVYTFERPKTHGVNPGMTVTDSEGREWSVKQGTESHVEVFLSRVLAAVGYHQPPVYFMRTFTLKDKDGVHTEEGGRFRLKTKQLDDLGEWSWQRNPFVGTKQYNGLLAMLMLFGSSDLKNSNNTLYRYDSLGRKRSPAVWYVVRDIGTALGETGHVVPRKNDPVLFARAPFISGVDDGFVVFGYRGWHRELVAHRIRVDDLVWACRQLAGLSDAQWREAFRTAGYDTDTASQFFTTLKTRIDAGLALATSH
jgi:hypothetical protein